MPAWSLGLYDRPYDTAPISRPLGAYTGEPDMPAQIPRHTSPVAGSVISDPDMRAMIMSMPGAMPSSIFPTIVPVNSSGWVPWLTVSPVTSRPLVTWASGYAWGQSAAAATDSGAALASPDTVPASRPQVASIGTAVRERHRDERAEDDDMRSLP